MMSEQEGPSSIPRTAGTAVTALAASAREGKQHELNVNEIDGSAPPHQRHRSHQQSAQRARRRNLHHYNCVECLSPSPSLYKVYSTPTSTRLTRCPECGNDVDPYVERELLLVGIDLVLHRLPAYRHVLFNREPFASFGRGRGGSAADVADGDGDGGAGGKVAAVATKGRRGEDDDEDDGEESAFRTCKRAAQYTLAGALLDAYLRYEAMRSWSGSPGGEGDEDGGDAPPSPAVPFPALVALSFFEHAALVLGVHAAANAMLKRSVGKEDRRRGKQQLWTLPLTLTQAFVALTIPVAAKFAAIFILIWENTETIGVLSSLFVLSFQFVATRAIVEREAFASGGTGQRRGQRQIGGRILLLGALPLGAGVVVRAALSRALAVAWFASSHLDPPSGPPLPCSGISAILSFVGAVCLT